MGKALIIKGTSFEENSLLQTKTIGSLSNSTSGPPNGLQSTAFYTSKEVLVKRVTLKLSKDSTSDFAIYKDGKLYKTIKSNLEITRDKNDLYTLDFDSPITIPADSTFGFTSVWCEFKQNKNISTSDGYSSSLESVGKARTDINWGMEAVIYIENNQNG